MTTETIDTSGTTPQPLATIFRRAVQAGRTRLGAAVLSLLSARYALPPPTDAEEEPYDEATMVAVSLLCSVHF